MKWGEVVEVLAFMGISLAVIAVTAILLFKGPATLDMQDVDLEGLEVSAE